MAKQDRFVVVVLVEQLDQAVDADGQLFDRKVTSSMITVVPVCAPPRRPGRLSLRSDRPQLGVFFRVFGEVDLFSTGKSTSEAMMCVPVARAARSEMRREIRSIARRHWPTVAVRSRHARFVLHRAQTAAVEQLDGRHGLVFEDGYSVAAGLDIREHDQRRSLVRMVDHGVVGHRADKAQVPSLPTSD